MMRRVFIAVFEAILFKLRGKLTCKYTDYLVNVKKKCVKLPKDLRVLKDPKDLKVF